MKASQERMKQKIEAAQERMEVSQKALEEELHQRHVIMREELKEEVKKEGQEKLDNKMWAEDIQNKRRYLHLKKKL